MARGARALGQRSALAKQPLVQCVNNGSGFLLTERFTLAR